MFALVDGNNFYVSCERIFRPSLNGKPVVVLANNDGCAIARSDEAKALGIKMGAPWFQIKQMAESDGLVRCRRTSPCTETSVTVSRPLSPALDRATRCIQ